MRELAERHCGSNRANRTHKPLQFSDRAWWRAGVRGGPEHDSAMPDLTVDPPAMPGTVACRHRATVQLKRVQAALTISIFD